MLDPGTQLLMVLSICGAGIIVTIMILLCEQKPETKEIQNPEYEPNVVTVVHKIDKNETPIEILQRRLASGEISLDAFHSLVQRC